MDRERIKRLLKSVRERTLSVDEAIDRLKLSPVEDLGFATLDLHRAVRRGFPEVVYGPGKTAEQIAEIVQRIAANAQTVLVTRVDANVHRVVQAVEPRAEYHAAARSIVVRTGARSRPRPGVLVVTAGTSDIPVAEEAALTAQLMGNAVERIYDVGVAGIHRLLAQRRKLTTARVIVAVAGMEGALPSVICGLTDCPVIGVPTSTGYGAGRAGEAALLAMLNSCAGGLTVVNIDNGFGAGFAAGLINRPIRRGKKGRQL